MHRHYQDLNFQLIRERRRLQHAASYLKQQNKLAPEEYTKLCQMITHRSETIRNHFLHLYQDNERMKAIRDQLQENVKQKKEDMLNPSDSNHLS